MALGSGSGVVAQDAAEALPTVHRTGPAPDLSARVDQAIAQALVVAFRVIVRQELANSLTQRRFAEEDQAVDTFFLEAAHEALQVGIEVWRPGRQPHGRDADILQDAAVGSAELRVAVHEHIAFAVEKAFFRNG